ncbi:aldehyde dehydrogenase family protein, partial [Streptococcus pyogenes]
MTYQTIYPFTNEVLKTYDNATDADLETALDKAHLLYKKWRVENDLQERKIILHKVAELLRRDADKYAEIMTKD